MSKPKVVAVNVLSGRKYRENEIIRRVKGFVRVWDKPHKSTYWIRSENVEWF